MGAKENILIICSQNSARSQMAEGFLRCYGQRRFNIFSAGFEPALVNPLAVQVMSEIGIDISQQRSKSVREFLGKMSFGHVIAVCKKAEEQCPVIFPSALKILSWPFDDPADFQGTVEEKLAFFRRIRNEIEMKVIDWLAGRNGEKTAGQEFDPEQPLRQCSIESASRKRVLFLCTHNSARSQMAENLMNVMMGDLYEAYSAGIEPGKINPYVVRALAEIGIDISANQPKSVDAFAGQAFDIVVTVCDRAGEVCPIFPGATQTIHHSFDDPSKFSGTDEEIMVRVREVRDEIRSWLADTFLR